MAGPWRRWSSISKRSRAERSPSSRVRRSRRGGGAAAPLGDRGRRPVRARSRSPRPARRRPVRAPQLRRPSRRFLGNSEGREGRRRFVIFHASLRTAIVAIKNPPHLSLACARGLAGMLGTTIPNSWVSSTLILSALCIRPRRTVPSMDGECHQRNHMGGDLAYLQRIMPSISPKENSRDATKR